MVALKQLSSLSGILSFHTSRAIVTWKVHLQYTLYMVLFTVHWLTIFAGSRCIKEEAHKDVLVVGEFTVESIPETHEVDILVR